MLFRHYKQQQQTDSQWDMQFCVASFFFVKYVRQRKIGAIRRNNDDVPIH